MKIKNWIFALFALALFSGIAMAATGPLLQISSYNTTPSTVYAGTVGYLQITLKNNGDSSADSVQANYDLEGSQSSYSLGDIGSTSEVQFVVPFKALPESAGGIQLVGVDVYYLYSQSSSTGSSQSTSSSKKVSLRVPVTVSQNNPLEVNTISFGTPSISPGEKLSVVLELKNIGGVVNNLFISTPANSSFSIDGTTQKLVGTIDFNSSKKINLTLSSSSSTEVGSYNMPLIFTYYDRLNRPFEESFSIGPISVLDTSLQYRLELVPQGQVEVGSQVPMKLKLTNTGSSPISAVVDLNSTGIFTPVGMQRAYFDSIGAGASSEKDIVIGVSSSATPGYYSFPLKIMPSTGTVSTEYIGLVVQSTPSITISIDKQSAVAQILIANTGNSQIHSAYAIARQSGQASSTGTETFLGTLNVDDYSSMDVSSIGSSGIIDVEVHFKDSSNAEHVITQAVDMGGLGFSFGSSNSTSNRTALRGGAGGIGGLFGGRSSGGGLPLIPIAIVAIIAIALCAYFLYYKPKKKKEEESKKAHDIAKALSSPVGELSRIQKKNK